MSYADEAGIPVEFRAALELTPNCWTLRGALADRMREQGDEIGADAVLWSALEECRLEFPYDGFGWSFDMNKLIPWALWNWMASRKYKDTAADTIGRIVIGWRKISGEWQKQLLKEAQAQCGLTR